jgi:predicted lipoprotein with Yx(FWY)xxD motif
MQATPSVGLTVIVASAVALLAGCGSGNSMATSASNGAMKTTSAARRGVTVGTKHGAIGTILAAGPKLLTVYLREGEKGSRSACHGACAKAWAPVTTTGRPVAAGGVVSAILGFISRPDGTKQVTYKGHPLYYFAEDRGSGDWYGQGLKAFGAHWYVVTPIGYKVASRYR